MINLDKIQKKVDKLFAGETKKSLTQWLKNHRKGNNPYDINLSFSTDSDYGIRKGDKITIPGGNTYMVTRDYGNNKFRAERIKKGNLWEKIKTFFLLWRLRKLNPGKQQENK